MKKNRSTKLFTPSVMCQIDISEPIPPLTAYRPFADNYERGIALILLFGKPVGAIEVYLLGQDMVPQEVAAHIWKQLSVEINERLRIEGLSPIKTLTAAGLSSSKIPNSLHVKNSLLQEPPRVSVVVATHNRLEGLKRCLASLLAMDYLNFDIIVVDNAPSNNDTAAYIIENFDHDSKINYVYEPNPGLAIAHKRRFA